MAETALPVLHGIDQCVPSYAKLPAKGNMASETLTEDLLTKHVYDAASGVWLPIDYIAARYDFAVDGGAVGDIDLGVNVPAGTIILDGMLEVLADLTSEGAAEIQIHLIEISEDILANVVIASTGPEGMYDIIPDGTATNMIKTTNEDAVILTIGVADLTAGVLVLFLRCVRGFSS